MALFGFIMVWGVWSARLYTLGHTLAILNSRIYPLAIGTMPGYSEAGGWLPGGKRHLIILIAIEGASLRRTRHLIYWEGASLGQGHAGQLPTESAVSAYYSARHP